MMLLGFSNYYGTNRTLGDPCNVADPDYDPTDPVCALFTWEKPSAPASIAPAPPDAPPEMDMTPPSSAGPRVKVGQMPSANAGAALSKVGAFLWPILGLGLVATTVFVGWKVLGPGLK